MTRLITPLLLVLVLGCKAEPEDKDDDDRRRPDVDADADADADSDSDADADSDSDSDADTDTDSYVPGYTGSPELLFWLDADTLSVGNGGAVTTWNSRSAGDVTFTGSGATFFDSLTDFGGEGAVEFLGGDTLTSTQPLAGLDGDGAWTVMMVAEINSVQSGTPVFWSFGVDSVTGQHAALSLALGGLRVWWGGAGAWDAPSGTWATNYDSPHIITVVKKAGSIDVSTEVFGDGLPFSAVQASALVPQIDGNGHFVLGNLSAGRPNPGNMTLGEILFWRGTMTTAQRVREECRLFEAYGIFKDETIDCTDPAPTGLTGLTGESGDTGDTGELNVPPTAVSDVGLVATTEVALPIDVLANDTDADGTLVSHTVTVVTDPTQGSVSRQLTTGQLYYTASSGASGSDSFTYTVEDDDGAVSNVATVSLSINDRPVANDDAFTVPRNIQTALDVAGNDTDGDGLAFITVVTPPTSGFGDENQPGTGMVDYLPATNFVGVDTFEYVYVDTQGGSSAVATVTITVVAPPDVEDDNASGSAATPIDIDVLANDNDVDDAIDPTTVLIADSPGDGGVVVNSSTGVITYTSNGGFNGQDGFSYTVADTSGNRSSEAYVSVIINEPPVAVDDSFVVLKDTPTTLSPVDNDTDPDGDGTLVPATLSVTSQPVQGTAAAQLDGTVLFTPAAAFSGTVSFTYSVADLYAERSNDATVTVRVNDPPVAADDAYIGPLPATIDVLANDSDNDGTLDPSTVTVTAGPTNATVDSINPTTGEISLSGCPGAAGFDELTYTVADNNGSVSNGGTLTLAITCN